MERLNNRFWLLLTVLSLLTLMIGLFPHGGVHGLFCDDYIQKAWAFDLQTGHWRLQTRPVHASFRYLHSLLTPNLVNAIPEYEFPVRVLWALVHLGNALLLGLLAYRLTGAPLATFGVTSFFLMPLPAHEVLLWHAATVPYAPALLAYLGAAHLSLSAVRAPRLLIPAGILLVIVPLFNEAFVFLVVLLPVMA